MNEFSPSPDARQEIRDLNRKAFLVKASQMGRELPSENEAVIHNTWAIDNNLAFMFRENGEASKLLDNYNRQPGRYDLFNVQHHAIEIADAVFEGTEQLDLLDYVTAIRGYEMAASAALGRTDRDSSQRFEDLSYAFEQEAAQRIDFIKLHSTQGVPLFDLYKRAYAGDEPWWQEQFEKLLSRPDWTRIGRVVLFEFMEAADLHTYNARRADIISPNAYNMPLSDEWRGRIDANAAETIEGVHLLKAYGVTPAIVPAKALKLPFDVAMLPPLDKNDAYQEGSVIDLTFLDPVDEPRDMTLRPETIPGHEMAQGWSVDGAPARMRFRLHDNGQISGGPVYHGVPSDIIERSFTSLGASDAFIRLRGLCIALAFDATAHEEVVRERTGGSVASQFVPLADREPHKEAINTLLLHRRRELGRAQVTRHNRIPQDWPKPVRDIGGFQRRLQEGTRRRPTAEDEARIYYQSIRKEFTGLLPGHTFVNPYKRGTVEQTTFREAHFRRTSKTNLFLGLAGIVGASRGRKRSR